MDSSFVSKKFYQLLTVNQRWFLHFLSFKNVWWPLVRRWGTESKFQNSRKNGKNMNSQRISFLSVAWLLLHSSYFLLPCGSCVTCLFLEGHFGIHLEVASDSFCFLINSSWLLVFILYVFSLFFLGFNLYCLKGIHFS